MTEGYHSFETALGVCALAWSDKGLTAVFLPQVEGGDLQSKLGRRYPDAVEQEPPPAVAGAVSEIKALLTGEKRDLREVMLDDAGVPEFNLKVYAIARTIPPGQTLTYGDIARRLGEVSLSRAVGQALGANPWPIVVPCHRVLASGGKKGGFSAPGGADTKLRMLEIEGALAPETLPLFGGR